MVSNPPLTIVTGFLGSGKTTLLRALLERGADGRRVAMVVNEFGQVGLDGAALERAGAPVVELPGGCVCCEAGSDFLLAVEELRDYEPDQIVVEASGLAEPGGIIRRARGAGLALDAVVAVADAANLDEALAASPVAAWQLRSADLIVLSKVDLVAPAARAAAEARLRGLNPRAAVVPAAYGAVPAGLLFGPRPPGEEPEPAPGHGHGDGFAAVTWRSDAPLRRAALEAALAHLPATVYRAKGLVHCTDAPWPDELHLVCGRHALTAVRLREPAAPLNTLVLLGPGLDARAEALRAALDACADTPERAAGWRERYAALFA
ncbi:MAG TPA: GTP-binding protein [Chloroflexaceae bacterium]|nr:GTP-binding protein [Chloroflexaceae bacterium]